MPLSGRCLNDHGGAVAEDFRNARGNLRRVETHRDHGIGTPLRGMAQQELESIAAGPIAKLRIERDIAAEERLGSLAR